MFPLFGAALCYAKQKQINFILIFKALKICKSNCQNFSFKADLIFKDFLRNLAVHIQVLFKPMFNAVRARLKFRPDASLNVVLGSTYIIQTHRIKGQLSPGTW